MLPEANHLTPRPVCIDFETHGIAGRPDYPPVPVGVAIKWPGCEAIYYAWGHPTGNNCSREAAHIALQEAYDYPGGLLFQNAKFDIDVASAHFGLPIPEWSAIHDTMFLLFLDDPHQPNMSLKPSAERLLGLPPEEQDAVGNWLIEHQPVSGVKISAAKSSEHYFGRYICEAPGDLVGEYAKGDVDRTVALFELLWPKTRDRDMLGAYDRERQLMLILLDMERRGLPVNLEGLRSDCELYSDWHDRLTNWILQRLGADHTVNIDSSAQLLEAMKQASCVDINKMPLTATGKVQTSKDALLLGVTDKLLLAVMKYRTQLGTCLRTFMVPWLAAAEKSGGLIYTNWNQIRSREGGSAVGTTTGRLSSTPNFQNIPKAFPPIFAHELEDLPECPWDDLPPLPEVRSYVIPFPGETFIDRDYSQQEPRILAHFDGGNLAKGYQENPWLDLHDYAKQELANAGKYYERKRVKTVNLGLMYGMGVGKMAAANDMTVAEATELKKAVLSLYPGLQDMYKDMRARARSNIPFRTWGGREYYCEPAKTIDGKYMEFDYKMVNGLIQGSAADCTKEAIIRYYNNKHPDAKIVLNVHDQITVSVPSCIVHSEMETLRACMESVEFDVPILSEGTISSQNWNELRTYDKKGVKVNEL
jgi:DNA polymerase I-like protein with 3'-5' exonuclease and polymerase domains